jgi:hypothetical protein
VSGHLAPEQGVDPIRHRQRPVNVRVRAFEPGRAGRISYGRGKGQETLLDDVIRGGDRALKGQGGADGEDRQGQEHDPHAGEHPRPQGAVQPTRRSHATGPPPGPPGPLDPPWPDRESDRHARNTPQGDVVDLIDLFHAALHQRDGIQAVRP